MRLSEWLGPGIAHTILIGEYGVEIDFFEYDNGETISVSIAIDELEIGQFVRKFNNELKKSKLNYKLILKEIE